MAGWIALILALAALGGFIALGLVLSWALRGDSVPETNSALPRFIRRWMTPRREQLTYRRDHKGRFRKIRRG
ncbi:MAG: hypothetical protein KDE15_09075 [Erythrobacter sp.]|nr:hypothetical protein [Erythrobacter sp.]